MIDIKGTSVVGFDHAIRGMRNPMNSWEKSDSCWCYKNDMSNSKCNRMYCEDCVEQFYEVGDNDLSLMKKLIKAGTDHRKFMRMITVYCDILAPLFWWKEFSTYKVGTVVNSCSTMHKIHEKKFELSDFSCEHLGVHIPAEETEDGTPIYLNLWEGVMDDIIKALNTARNFYNNEQNPNLKKEYWWQMIQLLPTSYNQKRTVMLNYEVLRNMYHARKNHKLDEWRSFCKWIEELPYAELIVGE